MKKLDKVDWEIAKCLKEDVRMPAAEIARRLGITDKTVRNRIKKLVDLGVFEPYALFSREKFGYKIVVDVFLTVDLHYEENVINILLKRPEVVYVAYSSGEQDISIQAVFKNSDHSYKFLKEIIPSLPGLKKVRTVFALKVLKTPCQWQPAEEDFKNTKNSKGRCI